jgi:protein SCO1/2
LLLRKAVSFAIAVSFPMTAAKQSQAQAGAAARNNPMDGVGITQHLGAQVPFDDELYDESGAPGTLSRYFDGRPIILALVYYRCPMLCNEVLNGLVRSLRDMGLHAGVDYSVVAVSFDPGDTPELARQKRDHYVAEFDSNTAKAWHFLTARPPAIDRLTRAVGFNYRFDESSRQFAHPASVVVLTPEGRINRYLFGIDFAPRDLRLSLVEAADGKIGSSTDRLLLLCFHYDPATGKYGFLIMRVLRIAGALTVVSIGVLVWFVARKPRRRLRAEELELGQAAG